ncbi:molybdenum cofactor guanylyltransferase MobA [Salinisphaera aquimarina]|uniref:Molybdenum cofactor guanylyltransferase n=1 Tax=Salinisphaera aquimarina TaxID=2094031 RepID=A0ABV7EN24_9GAMM
MDMTREQITAGILAGGEGRRLGGIDKGWYEIGGRPLIEHTLARVETQCARAVISANRSLARYRALNLPVHVDDSDEFRGPLAGIVSVLRAATTPYVLIVPVDTPAMPADLAPCLADAMRPATELAVARCEDRVQPLHALMRRDVLADLETALFAGVRAVSEWHDRLSTVTVDWPDCAGFANINSEDDARALAERLQ